MNGRAPFRDLDPAITGYYDRAPDEARLEQQLEEARTQELIQRFAPPPGTVVDIGGAAGAYMARNAGAP